MDAPFHRAQPRNPVPVPGEGLWLRTATNADGPQVEALVFGVLAEYGLQPEPEGVDADLRDLERFYLGAGGWFGVWVDAAGLVRGSAGLRREEDLTAELRKMYLHPVWRGRGTGKVMLEQALQEARRLGFRRVRLETASVLREAVRLYEHFGFRPVPPSGHAARRCDLEMELLLG